MAEVESIWADCEIVAPLGPEGAASSASAGNAVSLIFDTLSLDLQTQSSALSAIRSASYRVPLAPGHTTPVLGYVQDIIGGIEKSPGTRVLIVADLGGTLTTIEYDFGTDTAGTGETTMLRRRLFSPIGVDLASSIGAGLIDPPPYEATFTLLIQRRTPDDFALVSVDSLDVIALLGAPITRAASS